MRLTAAENGRPASLKLTFHATFCLATTCCLLLTGTLSHAAVFDGHGQPNGNWSTPTNWVGNVAPVSGSPNLELVFHMSANALAANQDLGSPFELQRLAIGEPFEPLGPFTMNGAPIAFSNLGSPPSLRNGINSTVATINNDLVLNSDTLFSVDGIAGVTLSRMYYNGAISGAGGIVTAGASGGFHYFGGTAPNTYAGMTTINGGWFYLNKPDSVIAIPGDLILNRLDDVGTRGIFGRAILNNDNQIAATANLTLNGGTLVLAGGDQTLANVHFTGTNDSLGGLDVEGGDISIGDSNTLTITGDITRTSFDNRLLTSSSIIGGTLNLNGGVRSIYVDNVHGEGFPVTQLGIGSRIVNGDIEKTGSGILGLGGSFDGSLLINGGKVQSGLQMTFGLHNGGISNRIGGAAEAELGGTFIIDSSAITDTAGSWNLVDVGSLTETFTTRFKVRLASGVQLTKVGDVFKAGRWEFSTTSGNLTLGVPEPAAVSMLAASGIAALGAARRYRRRDSSEMNERRRI